MANGIELTLEDPLAKKDYVVFIPEGELRVFGRNGESDVQIEPYKKMFLNNISRRHFVVECKNGGLEIADFPSHNGTYVNGLRIGSRGVPLRQDFQIGIGFSVSGFHYDLQVKKIKQASEDE